MSHKKKILVVEDEQDMRQLLYDNLSNIGYEVYQAADGEEGFSMAKTVVPDMIISDIIMPRMNGNDLYKKIHAHDFGKKIPFIVLTARKRMRDYFEVAEVDDFIEKPFDFLALAEKIEKLLKNDNSLIKPFTKFTFRKVLVVGNDNNRLETIVETLKAEGWHPDFVNCGVQVISKAVLFLPVIVLLDVHLGDMPTEEIIKILRTMPQFQAVPILIYGSDLARKILKKNNDADSPDFDDKVKICLDAGADEFLEKNDEKYVMARLNSYLRLGVLLLIDPEEEVIKMLKTELEVEGAKVFMATDTKTGLKLAQEIVPNLVILNASLRENNGYDFLKALKADETTRDISVILYKPQNTLEKGEVEKGLDAGADDFIPTPFNGKLLVKRIQSIVDLKRKERSILRTKTKPKP